jgi:hypothetical protein
LEALERLNDDARETAIFILGFGCQCGLPDSVHMPVDRVAEVLDLSVERIKRALRGLDREPEFTITAIMDEEEEEAPGALMDLRLSWEPMTPKAPAGNATKIASAMIREAGFQECGACHKGALDRLDFSRTSSMLDWNGDDFDSLDENSVPQPLREMVGDMLDAGWTFELAPDHLRFLEPDGLFYDAIRFEDRHDPGCVRQACADLEALIYGLSEEDEVT